MKTKSLTLIVGSGWQKVQQPAKMEQKHCSENRRCLKLFYVPRSTHTQYWPGRLRQNCPPCPWWGMTGCWCRAPPRAARYTRRRTSRARCSSGALHSLIITLHHISLSPQTGDLLVDAVHEVRHGPHRPDAHVVPAVGLRVHWLAGGLPEPGRYGSVS